MSEEAPVDVVPEPNKGDESNEAQDDTVPVDTVPVDTAPVDTVQEEHVEHIEGEHVHGEEIDGEHTETEHVGGEQTEGEQTETEAETPSLPATDEKVLGEGEELMGEGTEAEGQQAEGQQAEGKKEEEMAGEEEAPYEESYVDPAAPYDLSDSKELLAAPFKFRPQQVAELEELWELFVNCTPAYAKLDNFVTEKELLYMLDALMLRTYTPEQFQELLAFCVRPPHPKGHINYEQFVKIALIRQRTQVTEEEIQGSLQLHDPENTGSIDRERFREWMLSTGQMTTKVVDAFIKEVDIAGDGTLGINDIVSTMMADLGTDEIIMYRQALYGTSVPPQTLKEQQEAQKAETPLEEGQQGSSPTEEVQKPQSSGRLNN